MVKNKFLRWLLTLSLMFHILPNVYVRAQGYGETKTEVVNVAKFRPVDVSRTPVHGNGTNLVDDHNNTDLVVSYSNTPQWVSVDLQRRYKIDYIEVASRSSSSDAIWLSDFEIHASNTANFDDYEIIGECKSADGNALIPLAAENMRFECDGNNAYQYVRLYSSHMMGFSELRVYAEQTVTEIVPETVTAGNVYESNTLFAADKAVDGNLGTCWIGEYTSVNNFIRFDLGEAYNIGYIEMYARNDTEFTARNYFDIYGSNDISQINDSDNLNVSDLSDYGYTKTAYLNNPAGEYTKFNYDPYPANGKFTVTVDEKEPYRYITLKKRNTCHFQVAEIKAYVINPVVNNLVITSETLRLEFSDEMNTETFSNIHLESTDGNSYPCVGNIIDGYTYEFNISEFDKESGYKLNVNGAKNLKGVSACGEINLNSLKGFSALNFGCSDDSGTVTGELFYGKNITVKADIINMDNKPHSAMLAAAFYKNGQLVGVNSENKTFICGEKSVIETEITAPDGLDTDRTLKIFLWDTTNGSMMPMENTRTLRQALEIYVSPTGDDNAEGMKNSPYSTLAKAQETVRELNSDMYCDINVNIQPGIYELDDTWNLTDEDNGQNGYKVNYKAVGDVTVSGGRRVNNWEHISGNLYRAPYSGESLVHELYVDGVKAVRATADEKVTPKGFYYADEENVKGVIIDAEYASYINPDDMQLHYTRGWKSIVCNVESIIKIDKNTCAFILGEEFANAINVGTHSVKDYSKFYLENVYEYLDEAGEFYYNEKDGYIYYMTDGNDMSKSIVYVAVLEQLVNVEGKDLKHKAKNITFDGIRFAHSAWNYPIKNGYIGGQAQSFSGVLKKTALDELGVTMVDAGIQIKKAENIEFTNNEFTGIAKVGVGLYQGASNNRIEGNTFYSIGDSAVTVGLPSDNYMEPDYEGYNLAFNKVCTSSNKSNKYPAYNVTNGSARDGWSSEAVNGGFKDAWWQVDLGDTYEIDRIEIDAREGYDQNTTRRYFEILASNDPEFKQDVVRIAKAENNAFGVGETWRADVEDSGEYRYVRLRKTVNEYMYLAELRVLNLSMENIPQKEVCKNNKIYNNCITAIGEFNYGAPGIQTYYTENVDIAHNYIYNVPYTGIGMGWGWTNDPTSVTSRENKIRNNTIDNFSVLMMDGGGVYTLGQQPDSIISGNYIKNQNNVYGAIYADNGSKEYSAYDNIMENVWLSLFVSDKTKKNLTFKNNWSTTSVSEMWGENCIEENTRYFIPGDMPDEVKRITDNAGLADEYKSIISKVKIIPHEYTNNEIIDNVMGEISGSMPDDKLLKYALKNIITGAKTVYNTANSSKYDEVAFATLQKAIDAAQSEYECLSAEITAAINNGFSSTSEIIDRTRIFEAKTVLDKAVRDFLKSKK